MKKTLDFYPIFLLALFCLTPLHSASADKYITVIYNPKYGAYQEIVQNFTREVEKRGYIVNPIEVQRDLDIGVIRTLVERTPEINKFLLAIGDHAADAAVTCDTPGIFLMVSNPIDKGLVDPKGNPLQKLTGINSHVNPIKKLEMLSRIFPEDKNKIGVIYNPAKTIFLIEKLTLPEDQLFGMRIYEEVVADQNEVIKALKDLKRIVDFILGFRDVTVFNRGTTRLILRFSLQNKIPLIGFSPNMTKAGALISFHYDYSSLGVQAAELIKKLEKQPVSEVPLQDVNNVQYSINLHIADIMKITFPPEVIQNASRKFE
jgi:putative ABC transport system substrate-binding protein